MNYWLLKTEPNAYSIDNLELDGTTAWTGIRNYLARNMMRDLMQTGDLCIIYHSSAGDNTGAVGVAKVSSDAYPDPTQFDAKSDYFEPKATKAKPVWMVRDISFVEKFANVVHLSRIKLDPAFAEMELLRRGNRLSIQRLSKKHFEKLVTLGSRG